MGGVRDRTPKPKPTQEPMSFSQNLKRNEAEHSLHVLSTEYKEPTKIQRSVPSRTAVTDRNNIKVSYTVESEMRLLSRQTL